MADAQALIAQQATEMTHLGVDNEHWRQVAQAAQSDLGAVSTERDQLAYQVKELSNVRIDLDKRLNSAQEALTDARVATATAQKDVDILNERLMNVEEMATKLGQERAELMQKLVEREAHNLKIVKI
ncbi:MAG: hypothetical protein K0R08_1800 [Solimicrobium sp.]|nr:hypothetical protein [Solimicrobium sp.]